MYYVQAEIISCVRIQLEIKCKANIDVVVTIQTRSKDSPISQFRRTILGTHSANLVRVRASTSIARSAAVAGIDESIAVALLGLRVVDGDTGEGLEFDFSGVAVEVLGGFILIVSIIVCCVLFVREWR